MRGEDDDLCRRTNPLDDAQGGQPIRVGHQQIQQDHGRNLLAHRFDRLIAIGRLADDLDIGLLLKEKPKALADDRVVVDDQHPNHDGITGRVASMTVPAAGRLLITSVPPSSATRSRINRRPRPWVAPLASGSKPRPSSATRIWAPARLRWSVSRIVPACACLMALANPSCATRNAASSAAGAMATGSSSASTLIPSRVA